MSDSDDASREAAPTTAQRWKQAPSLDLVYQLNEHCLELLGESADTKEVEALPMVAQNREMWSMLSVDGRRRAARMPFVMLDLHFADASWWRGVTGSRLASVPRPANGMTAEASERLVQETLMFAWQMAQSDRIAAQVTFGMLRPVAEIIGALSPRQVQDVASRASAELRVRWPEDARFWRDLLAAAQAGNEVRLAELQLHAKLLVIGALTGGAIPAA